MGKEQALPTPISTEIWDRKYRLKDGGGRPIDATFDDTVWRVARAAASVEPGGKRARQRWGNRFHDAIADLGFLPAGRILAGAGAGRAVTLFNCFVMGPIADDLGAIFDGVKEAALTMQQGGGIGHDFSTLRPKGAPVRSIGADASGPLSFIDVWDAMCRTIMSAGARRGAMMATMRCDHPDIETFIDAKADARRLRNFNLSVLVTDRFMAAVAADAPWDLVFEGRVWKTVPAQALWERIMRATYAQAEPGVIFIDRVNALNNLGYCEDIRATNPCGEQPLPAYGACLLGSINLAALVAEPFTTKTGIDLAALETRVATAVRFLDNVIDVSNYPLAAQREEAKRKRRIGLGVTGLADALVFCGLRYGSAEAVAQTEAWMTAIEAAAYTASAELAAEKGAFPAFDAKILERPNIVRLPAAVRDTVAKNGLRNGCLTSVAPTGTISLLAGNVSSGIEPVFDYAYTRKVLDRAGVAHDEAVEDYAYARFRQRFGADAALPAAFVRAGDLTPHDHLVMQAAAQRHVDSAISKTINCPPDIDYEAFADVYREAYELGLKGCTTFRPNPVTGAVLSAAHETAALAPAATATPATATAPVAAFAMLPPPVERAAILDGSTYKLKWPASDHAIYVTINDVVEGGRRRPFEIFINTRNLEHYAWTVALTRMISAVFRRGGDVTFVAEELKAVFDPQGGHWVGGHYVPSLLAAIGEVIERHMRGDGPAAIATGAAGARPLGAGTITVEPGEPAATIDPSNRPRLFCPRCSSSNFAREEGCWLCRSCGYSRCV
jgi:ribonucleoside-diphosphate reductase alpha chain